MKKELLAPAGDIEAGYAALYYGADAVYLGLKQFSARATAHNFSAEELNEFVGFAHHLKRKVYVTLNTLVQQAELKELFKNLDVCRDCHVDAIILQDLGVAHVIKKYYPMLDMHASTQMAVHNKAGAQALQKLGFSRVVLARELSLAEMKDIATIEGLELEAFIHGALCYSYSGLCQFSSLESGRSANRGKCLYPCRSSFLKGQKEEHCFSMKDMALEEDVLRMPVYSLKIEGRKKNALYVAAVTDYYRRILDGEGADVKRAQNIKQIFSRPWCKFHFKGKDKQITDKFFVGHRGLCIGKIEDVQKGKFSFYPSVRIARHDGIQIDVAGQEKPYGFSLQNFRVDGCLVLEVLPGQRADVFVPDKKIVLHKGDLVYLASSSEVKGAYGYQKPKRQEYMQRQGIDVIVCFERAKISASSCGTEVFVEGKFEPAQNITAVEEVVRSVFDKTGETPFELKNLKVFNPEKLFVPVSLLNTLRRKLYEQISIVSEQTIPDAILPRQLPQEAKWIIKTDDVKNVSLIDWKKVAEVIVVISPTSKPEDLSRLPHDKVRLALPSVARKTADFDPVITDFLKAGYLKWEVANPWGLDSLPLQKIEVTFDTPFYMLNVEAMQMAKEIGASRVSLAVEDTLVNMKDLCDSAPLPVTAVVYQDVPLFISAVCVRDNSCAECKKRPLWMSLEKDGKQYQVLSENCQTIVMAERPFSVAAECQKLRVDFYRADFCYKTYKPEEVCQIFENLQQFKDKKGSLKANLNRVEI